MSGIAPAAPKIAAVAIRGRKLAAKKAGKRKTAKPAAQASRLKTPMGLGIYIPASRVKHYLDPAGLNKRIEDAISELRWAEPHDEEISHLEKNDATGKMKKVVTGFHRTDLVPWDKLTDATRTMVGEAKTAAQKRDAEIEKAEKALAERKAKMSKEELARYNEKQAEKAAEEQKKVAERAAKAAQLAEDIKSGKVDAKKHPVRGPKKTTKYGTEIELLSKMRIRFSKDAGQQLAATICAMVHERTDFAIRNCIHNELKIVKIRHALNKLVNTDANGKVLSSEDPDFLPFASLIRNLPSYRAAIEAEEKRVADEIRIKEEKKAAKRAAKEAAKEAGDAAPVEAAPAPVAAAPVEEEDEEEDEASFGHYVRQVAHNVMNEKLKNFVPKDKKDKHPFEDIRISAEYRDWMSDVIIDFIRRFCPLLNGQIRTGGIKTVSRDTVRLVVNFYLESNGVDAEKSNNLFNTKFDSYQAWSKENKERKAREAAEKAAAKKAEAEKAAAEGKPAPVQEETEESDADESDEDESDAEDEKSVEHVPAPAVRRKKAQA
jgi:hypothetical protein